MRTSTDPNRVACFLAHSVALFFSGCGHSSAPDSAVNRPETIASLSGAPEVSAQATSHRRDRAPAKSVYSDMSPGRKLKVRLELLGWKRIRGKLTWIANVVNQEDVTVSFYSYSQGTRPGVPAHSWNNCERFLGGQEWKFVTSSCSGCGTGLGAVELPPGRQQLIALVSPPRFDGVFRFQLQLFGAGFRCNDGPYRNVESPAYLIVGSTFQPLASHELRLYVR